MVANGILATVDLDLPGVAPLVRANDRDGTGWLTPPLGALLLDACRREFRLDVRRGSRLPAAGAGGR